METLMVTCPTRGRVRYQTAQALTPYNPQYVWGPRGIAQARNTCRVMALETEGCQALVMVDDDVVPHPDALTLGLQPMLDGSVDCIIFPCPVWRQQKLLPNLYRVLEDFEHKMTPALGFYMNLPEVEADGLVPVDAGGFGAVAITTRVLRATGPFDTVRSEDGVDIMGEDIDYCLRMKRLGYKVCASPLLPCEHYIELPGSAAAASFVDMVQSIA